MVPLLVGILAMPFACKQRDPGEGIRYRQSVEAGVTVITPVQTRRSVGDLSRLTVQEQTQLRADTRYLRRLTAPGQTVKLNLADPRQYRFVLARVKLGGKTTENSPYFFESLANQRQMHLQAGLKTGTVKPLEAGQDPNEAQTIHTIPVAKFGDEDHAEGAVKSSALGGAEYTWIDHTLMNEADAYLAPPVSVEEYGDGRAVVLPTESDAALVNPGLLHFESFKYEELASGDAFETYSRAEIAAYMSDEDEYPKYKVTSVEAPVDTLPPDEPDGVCLICIDRNWNPNDCDIKLLNYPAQAVVVPLKGSIEITTDEHSFNVDAIQDYRDTLNACLNPADEEEAAHCRQVTQGLGSIVLTIENHGGGCRTNLCIVGGQAANCLDAGMANFWNNVAVTSVSGEQNNGRNKRLSWDLTNGNEAYFAKGCRLNKQQAGLWMSFPLPIIGKTQDDKHYPLATLSTPIPGVDLDKEFVPVYLKNSCLAAGTLVTMADGTTMPVEEVEIGAKTANPYSKPPSSVSVTATAKGVEQAPMVRIEDRRGRHLLMTQFHPVITPDRGPVLAKHLRPGDRVMTATGPSPLVSVARIAYHGKVYNLKVGTADETVGLTPDQTTFYGNGFLLGDGAMQSQYHEKELLAQQGKGIPILDRLPERWHEDYMIFAGLTK
jgi:hypothetical protein